jgi:protein-S-isoprenylcysteine O-methyltransferase Ste14/uncharacterized membrane protein (UPF0127 family)
VTTAVDRTGDARLREAASGVVVADRLRVAQTHWARMRGLLGTAALAEGEGLWLRPCRQVHMIGMRYAVDLAFLDDEHRIVRTVAGLPPGRISPRVSRATSVVELPVGTLRRAGLAEGSRLEVEGAAPAIGVTGGGVASAACNLLLGLFYAVFVWSHIMAGRATGRWPVIIPMVGMESLMVVLFVTRRRSIATSSRPFDWVVGVAGSFVPLLLRTTEQLGPLSGLGEAMQAAGCILAIGASGSLGRSIGLVAANRGIKRDGLYRWMRHPLYTGYAIGNVGYLASFPSTRNLLLVAIAITAYYVRAVVEEKFLTQDPVYREYVRRVPWRFVPYIH